MAVVATRGIRDRVEVAGRVAKVDLVASRAVREARERLGSRVTADTQAFPAQQAR